MFDNKLLLVEDENDCLNDLKQIIEREGYSVDTASNGKEALELYKKYLYNLIITDINMPIMDGKELIKQINTLNNNPIIIVLSGLDDVRVVIDIMKAGVYDYLVKPVNIQELIYKIKNGFEVFELRKTKLLLEKEKIIRLEKQNEFYAWKERFLRSDLKSVDYNLFENIHRSFTQGYGFGNLITIGKFILDTSIEKDNYFCIKKPLFQALKKNIEISDLALEEFLEITNISTNKMELEEKSIGEFYNLLKNISNELSQLLLIKNQKIIINDYNNCLNGKIKINIDYLKIAIKELLINAMKFSKNNSKIIVLIDKDKVNNNIIVNFINEAVKIENIVEEGIPFGYENLIFEPFFRISKNIQEEYNTLDFGLGLTKVEIIVKKHNGKISCSNIKDYTDYSKQFVTKVNFRLSLPVY